MAPSSQELFDRASEMDSVAGLFGAVLGGIVLAAYHLVADPLVAMANGLANILTKYLNGLAEFMGSLGFGSAEIMFSGAAATADAVAREGILGFIIALVIVIAAAVIWRYGSDIGEFDVPFFGRLPFIGRDEED